MGTKNKDDPNPPTVPIISASKANKMNKSNCSKTIPIDSPKSSILEQFFRFYDFLLHVLTPIILYNGQKLINDVSTKIPDTTIKTIPKVPERMCVK